MDSGAGAGAGATAGAGARTGGVGAAPVAGGMDLLAPATRSPDDARRLATSGGTIVCLDVPEGTVVGLDYVSWRTGPKFMGVKMVPPGVHFFYYSARSKDGDMAPRTGLFVALTPGQVVVLKWDAFAEDFIHQSDLDPALVSAYQAGARRFELDAKLGAYPAANIDKWTRLCGGVTPAVLERVEPVGKAIVSAASEFSSGGAAHDAVQKQLRRAAAAAAKAEEGAEGADGSAAAPPLEMTAGLRHPGMMGAASLGGVAARTGDGAGAGAGAGAGTGTTDGAGTAPRSGTDAAGGTTGDGDSFLGSDDDDMPPLADSDDEAGATRAAAATATGEGIVDLDGDVDMPELVDDSPAAAEGGTDAAWPISATHLDGATIQPAEPVAAPTDAVQGLGRGSHIFFTAIPGVGAGSTPADRTRFAMDTTFSLLKMMRKSFRGDWALLGGELQFSFVCFLMGQSLEAFEQWKRLVDVLCRADELLRTTTVRAPNAHHAPGLLQVLQALAWQLQEVPTDFFRDNVSRDNFLRRSLHELATTCEEGTADGSVDPRLAKVGRVVRGLCRKRFRWDVGAGTVMPDAEDAPVVVDLSAPMLRFGDGVYEYPDPVM